jgi:outer membrane receptor for ferrienterochelin and colicin
MIRILIVIAVLALWGNNVYSQADSTALNNMSLKELLNVKVTTASKTLQEQNVAPATVMVISKDQIKIRGYQSLLDLMLDLPDFKVDDKIYSGQRNSVVIRGIQGQQNFFILLDGIKISSPTNEALPIMENYPIHLAEQVEIVYGPASALYGADAVSGVINIITRKVSSKKDLAVDAATVAGMYGYTNSTLYIAKKLGERSNLVMSGQYCYDQQPDLSKVYSNDTLLNVAHYKPGGTFHTIFGPVTPSTAVTPKYEAPTQAYSAFAALHIDDFTMSVFVNNTKTPSSWGNNTHNAVFNKDAYMSQSVSTIAANYRKTINRVTSVSTLSAAYYELSPGSNYRNLYTGMEPAYKYSTSVSVKAEQQVDYKLSRKMNLTGGFSLDGFSTLPQSADLSKPVNTTGNPQGSYLGTSHYYRPEGLPAQFYNILYYNNGVYAQWQYAASRKLNFTVGARYDHNSRYGSTFNPRLGLVFKASPQTTIKALFGSAYLAPPPSTAFVTYGSFETTDSGKTYSSPFLHLANPKLGPVRSQTGELNIRQYFTDNFMVTFDGYYTYTTGQFAFADDNSSTRLYNNMFNGIPVSYIEVFINEGEQKTYGGSVQFNFKQSVGNVFLNSYASVSLADGRKYTGAGFAKHYTELPFLSPVMVRIGTDIKAGKFSCSPRLLLMGRQNLPGIADTSGSTIRLQTISGYALLNVSARYEFSKRFAVFANVTNALNQRYRAVGFNMDLNRQTTELLHGQPQDPLRIAGGLNLTF